MVTFVDINDEKNTVEDVERDKEIISENLRRAELKREIALDTLEQAEADMNKAKLILEQLETRARQLRREKLKK